MSARINCACGSQHRDAASALALLLGTAIALGGVHHASALSWDPAGGGNLGGNGLWNNSPANTVWWTGAADASWLAGSDAVFDATGSSPAGPYTVSVDTSAGAVVVGNVSVPSVSGVSYTLAANAAGDALTLGASTFTTGAGADTLTISAPLVGAGSFTERGRGTIILSGANTYTGDTQILAGFLQLDGSLYGGTGPGNFVVGVGNNTVGQVILSHSDTFGNFTSASAISVTIAGSGIGSAFVNGTGQFNTINNLTLNGGTLGANGGLNSTFPAFQLKGTVTVGGTVPSSIIGSGTNNGVQLGNNTAGGITTFNVADVTGSPASDLVISQPLQNGRNTANTASVASGLTKIGPGRLELSSFSNNYTGPTMVNGGTLYLTGALTGTATTVNSGALATGGGTWGALTIANGGTYNPADVGATGFGQILNAAFTLQSGGHFSVDLGASGAHDNLFLQNGSVSLAGNLDISLVNGYVPQMGDTFNIIDNGSLGATTGSFANAPGGILSSGGYFFQVNYTDDVDGFGPHNDVTITVVPELQAGSAFLLGTALVAARRPRNRLR